MAIKPYRGDKIIINQGGSNVEVEDCQVAISGSFESVPAYIAEGGDWYPLKFEDFIVVSDYGNGFDMYTLDNQLIKEVNYSSSYTGIIEIMPDGNFYVTGSEPGHGYIRKYTPAGNLIWSKNTPSSFRVDDFSLDSTGIYFLTDGLVSKWDHDGNSVWETINVDPFDIDDGNWYLTKIYVPPVGSHFYVIGYDTNGIYTYDHVMEVDKLDGDTGDDYYYELSFDGHYGALTGTPDGSYLYVCGRELRKLSLDVHGFSYNNEFTYADNGGDDFEIEQVDIYSNGDLVLYLEQDITGLREEKIKIIGDDLSTIKLDIDAPGVGIYNYPRFDINKNLYINYGTAVEKINSTTGSTIWTRTLDSDTYGLGVYPGRYCYFPDEY